jgi:copper transport protein
MDAALKALLLLGAVLLVGRGLFERWVGPELAVGPARAWLRLGAFAGAGLLAVGSFLDIGAVLARVSGGSNITLLPAYLTQTRHGMAVVIRLALIAWLVWLGRGRWTGGVLDRAVFASSAIALLATFSVTSHAAGTGRAGPVAVDLIHFAAAAAWGGGLCYLAWLPIWRRPHGAAADVSEAVRRVSRLGLLSVAVLGVTGAAASVWHLWAPPALAVTPYGRALVGKLGVITAVLAVAAVNRWALVPAVMTRRALPRLGGMLKIESVLLVGVFALTGVLTTRPLPEPPATLTEVFAFRERAGPWTVRGSLSPTVSSGFDLELSVLDARGAPPSEPVDVQVAFIMPDHPMPPIDVPQAGVGRGSYRARVVLPMGGRWQMAIRVPEGGATVDLVTRSGSAPAGPAWSSLLPGAVAAFGGGGLALYAALGMRSAGAWRWSIAGGALAVAVAGASMGARLVLAGPSEPSSVDRPNPFPATPASIAAGERVYRQHCQICHGVIGAGDGPGAFALRPRPADLRIHMAAGHTDGQLFFWITEGFAGTAMPAYKATLSEEERWHVVNFIRTFALTDR